MNQDKKGPRPSGTRGRFHNKRTSRKARSRFAAKRRRAKAKGKPLGTFEDMNQDIPRGKWAREWAEISQG